MAPKQALKQWTLDELMAELRHRERKARAGHTRTLATPRVSARPGLAEVPTRELVHHVRGRQKVVYGVDDRKDIYQVKRKTVLTAADAGTTQQAHPPRPGQRSFRRWRPRRRASVDVRECVAGCPAGLSKTTTPLSG
jgi:hypothetical protein